MSSCSPTRVASLGTLDCHRGSLYHQVVLIRYSNRHWKHVLPANCTLVQYVDNLLIAAPTADACFQATMTVLSRLAVAGFKVSKDKLQLVRPQVTFLGREIQQFRVGMLANHRSAILTRNGNAFVPGSYEV